jgi:hypothetical protein
MINTMRVKQEIISRIVLVFLAISLIMYRQLSKMGGLDFLLGLLNGLTISLAVYYVILQIKIKKRRIDISI